MRTVIVGIGNDFRGDDGAGLAAVRLLKDLCPPEIEIIELNGEVTRILDSFQERDTAIIIDAVHSQHPPGTIHRFDASQDPLPELSSRRSTHGISIGSLLELARAQGSLPRCTIVYGIEAASFEHGAPLTREVEEAVHKAVKAVQADVRSMRGAYKHLLLNARLPTTME